MILKWGQRNGLHFSSRPGIGDFSNESLVAILTSFAKVKAGSGHFYWANIGGFSHTLESSPTFLGRWLRLRWVQRIKCGIHTKSLLRPLHHNLSMVQAFNSNLFGVAAEAGAKNRDLKLRRTVSWDKQLSTYLIISYL